ncbi:hypothetical protein CcaverHIS002_0700740 [Cutaneotrichosporon cavernicola]|uniref:Uncharacterized protein n=1 Tax=Cutaneotrichosporon cavernicola TaxID=279322 RepID=A0AA48QYM5_9TREE|nr:uncharacterized protein CcaverHIS019_0700750 [Cutaneotrichosporon cavernicola]BEI86728.1 hypothetical protein CcaverHIS002_0700740 [Cutaneotrichosporon cavernicola]BEI94503.1 hypothetical protein CcaverHIS019_0700750 [Cutaneotrichosporon cavernicola]BEJ10038.1 hypothetical protein CcaverHIS641_0700730 [Cutaneotrichosporon cavernicola]
MDGFDLPMSFGKKGKQPAPQQQQRAQPGSGSGSGSRGARGIVGGGRRRGRGRAEVSGLDTVAGTKRPCPTSPASDPAALRAGPSGPSARSEST